MVQHDASPEADEVTLRRLLEDLESNPALTSSPGFTEGQPAVEGLEPGARDKRILEGDTRWRLASLTAAGLRALAADRSPAHTHP